MKTSKPREPQVEVGDRFRECDNRFYRIVEVVQVKGKKVQIKTIQKNDVKCSLARTWARADRFFRYSHGYRYLGGFCHECQIEKGGVVPSWGHRGITVTMGTCSRCLKRDATLIPSCDYNWPKLKRRAIWD